MKYIPLFVVVGFFCVVGLIGSGTISMFKNTQRVYNCQLAEISPDFPVEAKEGCRKLRTDKINEKGTIQRDSTTSGR
jgi:hypothetical protein